MAASTTSPAGRGERHDDARGGRWGRGCARPGRARSSRSTRLVIVPLVTSVCATSWPGESSYGAPARRSAESTSNSQPSSPCSANAAPRARSRWRASRETRESTCSGATSRSGRSRCQAATMRSTSSAGAVSDHAAKVYPPSSILTSRYTVGIGRRAPWPGIPAVRRVPRPPQPAVRRPAGPGAARRARRSSSTSAAAPGELTLGPRAALAAGPGRRGRLLAARCSPARAELDAERPGRVGARRTSATWQPAGRRRRPRHQRHAAVGAGAPGPAAALGRGAGARRLVRDAGAGQLRRPVARADARGGRGLGPRRRARRRCCAAVRRSPTPAPTPRRWPGSAAASTCGRRRTCTCWTPKGAQESPVLEWTRGTGSASGAAGPRRRGRAGAVPGGVRAAARAAYPRQPFGTVFPFRRIFAVAQRSGGTA